MEIQKIKFSQISALTGLSRYILNLRTKSLLEKQNLERSKGNQILLTPEQVKIIIKEELINQKGKIIYIGNLKGGVGKTTLAYLITNALSMLGLKCCVIDLDVQSNLTSQYVNINADQAVFFDVIENKKKIEEVIITISPTLDLLPSSLKNSLIQKSLSMQSPKNHLSWFSELSINYLKSNYDVIIVDTPPSLNTLNSVFCLCLKEEDNIIIPVCPDDFSIMGVEMFLDDINTIKESYKVHDIPKISIIINKFFQQQKTNIEILLKMGNLFGNNLSQITIKESAKMREIINNKIPLNKVTQGKDVYETIHFLLLELNIIKNITNRIV